MRRIATLMVCAVLMFFAVPDQSSAFRGGFHGGGFRGVGFRGFGFRGFGFRGFGFRGVGFRGVGFRRGWGYWGGRRAIAWRGWRGRGWGYWPGLGVAAGIAAAPYYGYGYYAPYYGYYGGGPYYGYYGYGGCGNCCR
jgi:hypothetical protein